MCNSEVVSTKMSRGGEFHGCLDGALRKVETGDAELEHSTSKMKRSFYFVLSSTFYVC